MERLKSDKSQSAARRDIFKAINKAVGQIGGTQEQVSNYSIAMRNISLTVRSHFTAFE